MQVEREAQKILTPILLMLTEFRDPMLRDLTRLKPIWNYLCRVQSRRSSGGFLGIR